jgi:signal peptidase
MLARQDHLLALRLWQDKTGYVDIPSHGFSMYPLIRTGDICRFERFELSRLRRGDILLFIAVTGELIGHRYYRQIQNGDKSLFLCKGDSNRYADPLVELDRIVGRMVWIRKSYICLQMDHVWMRLWGWTMLTFPWVSGIIRFHLRVIRKLRGMMGKPWAS